MSVCSLFWITASAQVGCVSSAGARFDGRKECSSLSPCSLTLPSPWSPVPALLSRWPSHVAAAEDVNVEMVNGLAAVGAGVDHHAIALREASGARNFSGSRKQMAEKSGVRGIAVGERDDVLARNHKKMRGGLRVDVKEPDAFVVLVDLLGGDGSSDDLAEEAIHGGISLQEWFVS